MLTHNYFQFFSLPQQFDLELKTLESNYRKIQSESHPDRFITATSAEKLASMQMATLANEAYQTLKNPANRAKYLLELHGITAINDNNTAMPMQFLMQQMEWREAIEDARAAKDIATLEDLFHEMQAESKSLQAHLTQLLDEKKDYTTATETTRKLIFIDKVCADIQKAIEQLE